MRKLRENMTLKEIIEHASSSGVPDPAAYAMSLIQKIALTMIRSDRKTNSDDYPDSFYESPPVKSFGRFGTNSYHIYGYLEAIFVGKGPHGIDMYKMLEGGEYGIFRPGLPTDVDADGYPE